MKLIEVIYIKGGQGFACWEAGQSAQAADAVEEADRGGADGILAVDGSEGEQEHEQFIGCCREIARRCGCPLYLRGNIRRLEDVKKYLYAGAECVWIDPACEQEAAVFPEAEERFGKDRVRMVPFGDGDVCRMTNQLLADEAAWKRWLSENRARTDREREYFFCRTGEGTDYRLLKKRLKEAGAAVEQPLPAVPWDELKKDAHGRIPCIVQDDRTGEVLMMAYMDQAAYEETIAGGRMCYFSRSRQMRWLKGETSGHYQYVRELYADCDKDTLLAKVIQSGAACHTGAHSCFFNRILEKGTENAKTANPRKVLEHVYQVICDRKLHPKEGSYTNYLFDKGIDKILKKCGEEATEIVIAAKNPDPEELKYEISDFLYHMMVLMAQKGLTWEDISEELANR